MHLVVNPENRFSCDEAYFICRVINNKNKNQLIFSGEKVGVISPLLRRNFAAISTLYITDKIGSN